MPCYGLDKLGPHSYSSRGISKFVRLKALTSCENIGILCDPSSDLFYSGLQNAVKQLATSSGTFPGQGQSLGGSTSPTPDSSDGANNARAMWTNLDPQLKILLALGAAYIFFWLM